jgi:hypothetical protein
MQEPCEDEPGRKVDLSGKKTPKNVRAILNSGIEVPCVVSYDGQQPNDPLMRRYLVKAEIDWCRYWVKTLVIGEFPLDCVLILKVPDTTNGELLQYAHQMETYVEQRV